MSNRWTVAVVVLLLTSVSARAQNYTFDGGVYLDLGGGLLPEEPAAGLIDIDTGAFSWTTLRTEGMNVSFTIDNQAERQVYPLWSTYELVRFAHDPQDLSPLGARTSLGLLGDNPIWLYATGEDASVGSFQIVSRWDSFVDLSSAAVVPEPNAAVFCVFAITAVLWLLGLSRP